MSFEYLPNLVGFVRRGVCNISRIGLHVMTSLSAVTAVHAGHQGSYDLSVQLLFKALEHPLRFVRSIVSGHSLYLPLRRSNMFERIGPAITHGLPEIVSGKRIIEIVRYLAEWNIYKEKRRQDEVYKLNRSAVIRH